MCAILNNQPMGFWQPSVIAGDATRLGIPMLPVDIQCSQGRYTFEGNAIRLGLDYISGLGEASIERIAEERADTPFADLHNFCRHPRLPRRLVENLILAGAMDGWDIPRRNECYARSSGGIDSLTLRLVLTQPTSVPVECIGHCLLRVEHTTAF